MYDCILKLADTVRLMKRLFTILAIVTLLPSIAFAQVKKADAPIRQGYNDDLPPLYGDVESITIREYILEDKFGEVVKGEMGVCDKYTFNQRGDAVEMARYISGGSLYRKDLYKYDSAGNMIEKAEYNSSGRLKGKDLYKYDSAGNMIEMAKYYDGRLDWKALYKYDSAGNIIEKTDYKGEIMVPQSITEYKIVYR